MYIRRAMLALGVMAMGLNAADKPQISVVTIQTDNVVTYVGDITDPTKLATVPGATAPVPTKAFTYTLTVGDVVKVNGKAAKGLWSSLAYSMGYNPAPAPGFAISDASQGSVSECKWEIQTADGLLVGRFMDSGFFPHQITGGSGVFLGIRGLQSVVQGVQPPRRASMTEDPSLRRSLGGGSLIHTFHFAPAYAPAIEAGTDGPQIYHIDFSPVTSASPARAGESLIARASNLGLTIPAVDPGAAFPDSAPFAAVNAPVEVVAGGQVEDVINKLGWPGEVNSYRVDFQVPAGTPPGLLDVRLRVSGITGPVVTIPVK